MDKNLEGEGSKPSTSMKRLIEQTPSTPSLMVNDSSRVRFRRKKNIRTQRVEATDTAITALLSSGKAPKKAEQVLLEESVSRSALRQKRKLLTTNLSETKRLKFIQVPELQRSKVVVEKMYRLISASTSKCTVPVVKASQGLDALETPVGAESDCKDSQAGISVAYPASPSCSNVRESTVKNSSDQSQYLNVADFLEHDILEKGLEVLDFLDGDALDILIEKVMNVVNKVCGGYLEHELIEYLGPAVYEYIAICKSASFEDILQQYQQQLNSQSEHQTTDLVTDKKGTTSVGTNTFSSFDIEPSENCKDSELLTEADKSIEDRLKRLQKLEVPEKNPSWENVETKWDLLDDILNSAECDDQVKSASPPTVSVSSNEMDPLVNADKNTEVAVLKGFPLSPLRVNPSQIAQPSTAGASSTTQDGNRKIVEIKSIISRDIQVVNNSEKQQFNRVFYRLTIPPTVKGGETQINRKMSNESSSQCGQIGNNSEGKSVTELVQPIKPVAPLIGLNSIFAKLPKAEEVIPIDEGDNPLINLSTLPTHSVQSNPGTPSSNSQNQPEISIKKPNQKRKNEHSVILKNNVIVGKLSKTPMTYVASANKKKNVEDSWQEPTIIIRDANTKPTAPRCYSRSQLSQNKNISIGKKTPESQLSAINDNPPTSSTGAHVKSGENITITSEDSVKRVPEVPAKTTGQRELKNLDKCDNESDLNCATVHSDKDSDKSIDENCQLRANQITTDIGDEVDCPSSNLEIDPIEDISTGLKKRIPVTSLLRCDNMTSGSKGKKGPEINNSKKSENVLINKLNIRTDNTVRRFLNFRRVLTDSNLSNKEILGNLNKEKIDPTNDITVKNLAAETSTKLRINEKETSKDNLDINELKADPINACEELELKMRDFCKAASDLKIDKSLFNLDKENIHTNNTNNEIAVKNLCGQGSGTFKIFSQKTIEINKPTILLKTPTSLGCNNEEATTAFVQTEVNSKNENISDKTSEETSKKLEEIRINKKETSEDNLHVSELKADTCNKAKLQDFHKEITDSNINKTETFSSVNKESIDTNNEIAVTNSCGQSSENLDISEIKADPISACEELELKMRDFCKTPSDLKIDKSLFNLDKENINTNNTNNEIAVKILCGQSSETFKIFSQKIIVINKPTILLKTPTSSGCNNEETTTAFVQTEVNSKNENISDKTGEETSKKLEEIRVNKKETSEDNLHVSELKAGTCNKAKLQDFHKKIPDSNKNKSETFSNVNKENIDTNNKIAVTNSSGHGIEKFDNLCQEPIKISKASDSPKSPDSLPFDNEEANTVFEPDDLPKADLTPSQMAVLQLSENPLKLNINNTSKRKKSFLKNRIKLCSSKGTRKITRNQRSLSDKQRYALIAKISMVSKVIQNRVRNFERMAHRIFNNKLLMRTLEKLSEMCWFAKARRISFRDTVDFHSRARRSFIVPRKTQRINRKADSFPVPIPQPKNMNVIHLDDALKSGREREYLYTKPLDLEDLKNEKSDSELLLGDSQETPTAVPDKALRRSSSVSKDTNEIIQCFFYEKPQVSCEENPLELNETNRMETDQEESLNESLISIKSLKSGPSSTCSAGTNNPKSKSFTPISQHRWHLRKREQTRYFLRKRGNRGSN